MSEEENKAIEFLEKFVGNFYEFPNPTAVSIRDYEATNIEIILNLIKSQQEKIEKKDKIIDEMADGFFRLYQERPGTMHKFFENGKPCKFGYIKEDNECKEINCKPCIKHYFEKKVEESNAK